MKTNNLILLVVVGLVLLYMGGYITTPGAAAGAGGAGVGTDVACPALSAGFTQTMANKSYDADKPGTAVASGSVIYLGDGSTGALNGGGLVTSPGKTYTVLSTASNYFSAIKTLQTPCAEASPEVTLSQKAVDTSISATVYNTDGITANSITGNLTIGAGGSGTFHVKMSQSAAYKHLSGDSGKFCVFVNMTASNATDFDPSQMSASFDNVGCTKYGSAGLSNAATPTAFAGSSVIDAYVCNGDFLVNDGGIHDLAVKIQAASSTNPGGIDLGIAYVGVDRYQDTISNKIGIGCVKNDGSAIQTIQAKQVYVK